MLVVAIIGKRANYETGDCYDCERSWRLALRNGILKEIGQ